MEFKPTHEQDNAINSKGPILVSAAAGSGKTAVLVKKIVSMITKKEITADKIMVVTFTNAAAAEFRSRIDTEINLALEKLEDTSYLEEQIMLLNNAYIGTTDSICLRLVRENFEILGVSPTVKVIDTAEYSLLKNNILTEIFKARYSENDKKLYDFLKIFPGDIDDNDAKNIILNFYEKLANQISREQHLSKIAKMYDEKHFMYWLKDKNPEFINKLNDVVYNFDSQLSLLDVDSKLVPIINDGIKSFNELLNSLNNNDYIQIKKAIDNPFKATWPSKSKKAPEDILKLLKEHKKIYDACIKKLKKIYTIDTNTIDECYTACKDAAYGMIDIVLEFVNKLNLALDEKGYVSFEHAQRLALRLLREFDGDDIKIATSCNDIVSKFSCVMVDEYQDTNNLQDFFFNAISDNGKNLFAVGDMKQSIYGFRGANPDNFKMKQVNFADYEVADESVPRRIFLNSNFRSRNEICSFVNYFFEGRMTEQVGSIDYSENEKLNSEAKFPINYENKTDVALINHQGVISKVELEALYIAKYITETMEKPPFLKENDDEKKEENPLRKAEYKDFAVFVRTDKGNINIIAKTLAKFGIPTSTPSDAPLRSNEVVTLLSLLKVINSKYDDISMISALMSPLFGYSFEEVSELKLSYKSCIYDTLVEKAKKGEEKAKNSIEFLNKIKQLSTSVSIGELIYTILQITSYKEIVLSMENGKSRANNISLFEELAFSFDENESYSLPAFLSYCEKIADSFSSDIKPDKNENTVKIMTMHKCKGLQYPICIISLNTKKFNDKDSRLKFISSEKYGIGFRYITDDGLHILTPAFEKILENIRSEQISEEMRIYYVALTRAEEKLLVLVSDNYNKDLKEEDFYMLNKPHSFSDWVLDAAFKSTCSNNARRVLNLPLVSGEFSSLFDVIYEDANGNDTIEIIKNSSYDHDEKGDKTAADYEKLFNRKYDYEYLRDIVAKTSVSNLVHKSNKASSHFNSRPYFAESGGLSSAEKGTALHKFMQHVNFEAAKEDLNKEIERLYEYKFLSKSEIDTLNTSQINDFLSSNLLNRVLASSKVYREYKFISDIPAKLFNDCLDEKLLEQKIIIQGAVDCMFIENDEIVIIDFKTDKMNEEIDFINTYKDQLDYYSMACSKIFNKNVKERYIYSLHLGKTIKV